MVGKQMCENLVWCTFKVLFYVSKLVFLSSDAKSWKHQHIAKSTSVLTWRQTGIRSRFHCKIWKKKTTINDKGTRHIVTSQNFTQKVLFYKVGVSRSLFGNTPCMQLFRGRLSEKLCTRQSRKVIWDMINALSLTLWLSNLLLLLFFSTRKHTSMASCAILWNFFGKQWAQTHPQYLSGLSRALFPTTFLEIAVSILQATTSRIRPLSPFRWSLTVGSTLIENRCLV